LLKDQNIDTTLVLVGSAKQNISAIKPILKKTTLAKVIFLKGLTSKDLAITYQLATVFVPPS
jgi:hypothetical protein